MFWLYWLIISREYWPGFQGCSAAADLISTVWRWGETLDPGISRMTITVSGDVATLEQVVKQLNKLVNVIKISNITEEPAVMRELMMIKVQADPQTRSDIQQIVETFRGKVVDVSLDSLVIEITGNEEKLEAIKILLQHFGIKELVRTGKVAMLRGSKTTRDLNV